MSWIKISTNLATKPAVSAIGMLTKEPPHSVCGRLLLVWAWADPLSIDGFVAHADAKLIDRVAGKKGFAAAMQSVDWLAFEVAGVRFPNWERHNSRSAKARAGEAERKRMQRTDTPAATSPEKCPDIFPDKARTREEERREEPPKPPKTGGGETIDLRSFDDSPPKSALPASLAESPAFVACWESKWLPYQMQRKDGRMPAIMTLEKHLQICAKLGPARAVAGLESAIEKSWAAPDENAKVAIAPGSGRPWDAAPDDWKAWWRDEYPPEDYPHAQRYEDGQWNDVPPDHRKLIWEGLQKKNRRSA